MYLYSSDLTYQSTDRHIIPFRFLFTFPDSSGVSSLVYKGMDTFLLSPAFGRRTCPLSFSAIWGHWWYLYCTKAWIHFYSPQLSDEEHVRYHSQRSGGTGGIYTVQRHGYIFTLPSFRSTKNMPVIISQRSGGTRYFVLLFAGMELNNARQYTIAKLVLGGGAQ
jgi:hypothetical protein